MQYFGGIMADDSFKDLMERLKMKSHGPELRSVDSTDIVDTLSEAPNQSAPESELSKSLRSRMGLDDLKPTMVPDDELAKRMSKAKTIGDLSSKAGSRMASKFDKMDILKKLGKGLERKAAGLAIGGPLALASELADASEIGISPRDEIIESTEYTPEQKKALLRGLDMKMKLRDESGDVSQDPTILKAKEIGNRLQEEYNSQMDEDSATAKFMERVPIEERVRILQEMKKRGLK
jgi:hypothetical protein